MGGFLQRLFFSLGVALGVVAPQPYPELAVRLFRSADQIMMSAEAEGAVVGTAYELAESGTRVAIRFFAWVEDSGLPPVVVMRSVRKDAFASDWIVTYVPEGGEKQVPSGEAAVILTGRAWNVTIGSLSMLEKGGTVIVSVAVGILDESGAWHPAGILWGYVEPSRRFYVRSPGDMSY